MSRIRLFTQNMSRWSTGTIHVLLKGYGRPILCTSIVAKNNDFKKQVLIHTRILQVPIVLNAQVGLLTHLICCAFPVYLPVAKNATNINFLNGSRDTQQQELFRILTGFPFHPSASKSWLLSSLCTANVCDIFSSTKQFIKKKSTSHLQKFRLTENVKVTMNFPNEVLFKEVPMPRR